MTGAARGGEVRAPFGDAEAIVAGELDAEAWRERYAEVAEVPIAATVSTRTPEPA